MSQRRPPRALGVVLLCSRIAEQSHQAVAQLLGDAAAHLSHRRRSGVEIGADKVAPLLGVELGKESNLHFVEFELDGKTHWRRPWPLPV
jgi:hypothetical protein